MDPQTIKSGLQCYYFPPSCPSVTIITVNAIFKYVVIHSLCLFTIWLSMRVYNYYTRMCYLVYSYAWYTRSERVKLQRNNRE